MQRVSGKVAIITGGGTGIGRACAELFAQQHARAMPVRANPYRRHAGAQENLRLVAGFLGAHGRAQRQSQDRRRGRPPVAARQNSRVPAAFAQ